MIIGASTPSDYIPCKSRADTSQELGLAEHFWREKPQEKLNAADDAPFNRLLDWLAGTPGTPFENLDVTKTERSWLYGKYRSLRMTQLRLAQNRSMQIRRGAIYSAWFPARAARVGNESVSGPCTHTSSAGSIARRRGITFCANNSTDPRISSKLMSPKAKRSTE
jgi:hypothetical protein